MIIFAENIVAADMTSGSNISANISLLEGEHMWYCDIIKHKTSECLSIIAHFPLPSL